MQTARPNFERWDFMEPVRRPSVLDPLMPRGLGTPLVESLASYVTRLAEAHVVSVWRLILHVLRPPHASRIPRSSIRYAYPVNGLGKVSEPFLRAFEVATQRADLQLLTLSVLDGCISQPGTFRTTEAWCPCCLEQWRAAELPLYSPLLWTLQAVTMCPIHKCPLADRCPHCQSRFAPLRAKALPGQCSICSKPLGAANAPAITASANDQEYNLWSSAAIGQLLAAFPNLQKSDLPAAFRENLCRCLKQTEGATRAYLAMSAGAAPCAFRGWVTGKTKPTLHYLCRLCHQIKLGLLAVFEGIPPAWRGMLGVPGPDQHQRRRPQSKSGIERSELREVLVQSLTESPAPSVAEIARRLNFRRAQTLWSREPELCRQIAERRRESCTNASPAKQLYPKSERRHLERVLRGYLAMQNPPSLNEIASQLGYKGSGSIRERFPEMCRSIRAKRKQLMLNNRDKVRAAIEAARTEVPPPTLKQIGRRLGYTCEAVIVPTFPEMCACYKEWRRAWFKDQRHSLCLAIRSWVVAEATPTVTSVCRHFGISPTYFQLNFPEDNKELVRRSAERARRARTDRARALQEEVYQIIYVLRQNGLYPSLPRVRSALHPGSTRYSPLIRSAIDEARAIFGPIMRQRNELGRFV